MNNFILHGYDRSGTSAIARTLAKHPSVELIFRPFNSGPIRKKMYEILDDSKVTEGDIYFFENLQGQVLYSSYFVSEWHKKFSSVQNDFAQGKLHTIVTNINHFSVKWVSHRFPKIEQWAIWRDPIQILNSCIKNKFYGNWYGDALEAVFYSVKNNEILEPIFAKHIDSVKTGNVVLKTAYLIATRNFFLFKNINAEKVIDYDVFKDDPNKALQSLLRYFNLEPGFDFSDFLKVDMNSIPSVDGYSKGKKTDYVIERPDIKKAMDLFEPLYESYPNSIKT